MAGVFSVGSGFIMCVIVISMGLMSGSAHRNTYLGEGNNGEKGTSNDNDYYYCSRDVGSTVNQPPAECFPFMCAALPASGLSAKHVVSDESLPHTHAQRSWISRHCKIVGGESPESPETWFCSLYIPKYANPDDFLIHSHILMLRQQSVVFSKQGFYCGGVRFVYVGLLHNHRSYT